MKMKDMKTSFNNYRYRSSNGESWNNMLDIWTYSIALYHDNISSFMVSWNMCLDPRSFDYIIQILNEYNAVEKVKSKRFIFKDIIRGILITNDKQWEENGIKELYLEYLIAEAKDDIQKSNMLLEMMQGVTPITLYDDYIIGKHYNIENCQVYNIILKNKIDDDFMKIQGILPLIKIYDNEQLTKLKDLVERLNGSIHQEQEDYTYSIKRITLNDFKETYALLTKDEAYNHMLFSREPFKYLSPNSCKLIQT